MSTEARGAAPRGAPPTRRARARKRRGREFALAFAGVVGVLLVAGLAGAAASTAQGPRVTDRHVDPAAAVAASGARLIITTTQALAEVDPGQVTVTPATPFAVDTAGRSVGIRFALPLWDDTKYMVKIEGVRGLGGGPDTTITQTFRTGEESFFLLQRGDDEDTIFRSDLSGEKAVPVFRHAHIEDYRATSSHLVVSVREDEGSAETMGEMDGTTKLIVTDLDGEHQRTLPLPGDGAVTNLQSADRGDLVGYTFTDADIGADGGRESMLFTTSLKDPDAEPQPVEVTGADNRVVQWRFVPETDRLLFVGFDGALWLADATGTDAATLGSALTLDGVSGSTAIVDRADGLLAVDLTDGSERPLATPDTEYGQLRTVVPVPGGGTVRLYAELDENGIPGASIVVFVADDGTSSVVTRVPVSDAVIRTCVSPNGRYAATTVAPDIIDNPYDQYLLPMPERVETHIAEIATGDEVVALSAFDSSWCRVPPQ
ncbi:hypothetical protein G5T42_05600 [Microbacterium sp. 4R-513]|uniref:hypothetical protein n=1 Tax=Microbacterium sp. 4R-513 TaxID=2567934 RepID=UPI0013E1F067|nr:hypothetical protein [Microbacterium sp. 4R-513]QIG39029.1 hypothetical protein G5T42_05600 [Microbacterium sp. 4R-513]